jgi:polyhydroxybutyrate depolymerase
MMRLFLAVLISCGLGCSSQVPDIDGGSAADAGSGGGSPGGGGGSGGGGGGAAGGGVGDGGPTLTPDQQALLNARPYRMVVPAGYDAGSPVPLLMLLHGYGATGQLHDTYFKFSELAAAKTFLLATPDGKTDAMGYHFWAANSACCDFYGSGVDDVAYLTAILDDAAIRYRVDPKRVYLVGHSNGAFMSHRMACEKSARIAAIVSLAGANSKELSLCQPTRPVAVLQVHGTADGTVLYDGGTLSALLPAYPGAGETVKGWAQLNGCGSTLFDAGTPLDLDTNLPGYETRRAAYACDAGAAELWTIQSGVHLPALGPNWGTEVWNFLQAHPKP